MKPDNIQITYRRSPKSQPCLQPICLTCTHMNTSQVISNKDGHSYPIRGNFHCKSSDVIYVMTCNVRSIKYVEETSNTMNCGCRGHESYIRAEKDYPVAIHYRSYNHTIDDYSITIVDEETNKNRKLRLEESRMTLLNTLNS